MNVLKRKAKAMVAIAASVATLLGAGSVGAHAQYSDYRDNYFHVDGANKGSSFVLMNLDGECTVDWVSWHFQDSSMQGSLGSDATLNLSDSKLHLKNANYIAMNKCSTVNVEPLTSEVPSTAGTVCVSFDGIYVNGCNHFSPVVTVNVKKKSGGQVVRSVRYAPNSTSLTASGAMVKDVAKTFRYTGGGGNWTAFYYPGDEVAYDAATETAEVVTAYEASSDGEHSHEWCMENIRLDEYTGAVICGLKLGAEPKFSPLLTVRYYKGDGSLITSIEKNKLISTKSDGTVSVNVSSAVDPATNVGAGYKASDVRLKVDRGDGKAPSELTGDNPNGNLLGKGTVSISKSSVDYLKSKKGRVEAYLDVTVAAPTPTPKPTATPIPKRTVAVHKENVDGTFTSAGSKTLSVGESMSVAGLLGDSLKGTYGSVGTTSAYTTAATAKVTASTSDAYVFRKRVTLTLHKGAGVKSFALDANKASAGLVSGTTFRISGDGQSATAYTVAEADADHVLDRYSGSNETGTATEEWTSCAGAASHKASWPMKGSRTITASAKEKAYTVVLDYNGGANPRGGSAKSRSIAGVGVAEELPVAKTPTSSLREIANPVPPQGFTFAGWKIDKPVQGAQAKQGSAWASGPLKGISPDKDKVYGGAFTYAEKVRRLAESGTVTLTARYVDVNAPDPSPLPAMLSLKVRATIAEDNLDSELETEGLRVWENGAPYDPGKWTSKTVLVTADVADYTGVSKIAFTIDGAAGASKEFPAPFTTNPYLEGAKNTRRALTQELLGSGRHSGTVSATDFADWDGLVKRNTITTSFNNVMIDKEKPVSNGVEYFYNGGWHASAGRGDEPTLDSVRVRMSLSDEHSGFTGAIAKMASKSERCVIEGIDTRFANGEWSHAGTALTNSPEAVIEFSVLTRGSGVVRVRDSVGNYVDVPFEVENIDKKAPVVNPERDPDDPESDPDDPDRDPDDPPGGAYSWQEKGAIQYDWTCKDKVLSFVARDTETPEYVASGVKEMLFYECGSDFEQRVETFHEKERKRAGGTLVASSESNKLTYTETAEGQHFYWLEVVDKAGNITAVKVVAKVDKSAPEIPELESGSTWKIEQASLEKFGIDEVEAAIGTKMYCDFEFVISELLKSGADRSDSSGLDRITVKLANADDPSDYGTYDVYRWNHELEMRRSSGSSPARVARAYEPEGAVETKENELHFAASETGGVFTDLVEEPLPDVSLAGGAFRAEVNTFADFPLAGALTYEIEIADRAGNVTKYANTPGNEIKNFSVKAVAYYGSASYMNRYGNANTEYNVGGVDKNGKKTSFPYFMAGETGFLEVWTVGYVPKVILDFGEMGSESDKEIAAGQMPAKYELGSETGARKYKRVVPVSKAVEMPTDYAAMEIDGSLVPYAAHYGVVERTCVENGDEEGFVGSNSANGSGNYGRLLDKGTAIRIPAYYELKTPSGKKKDGRNTYEPEYHEGDVVAVKKSRTLPSTFGYIVYDTLVTEVHYRVIHES